ncbi:hypothetical protein KI387_022137, partial [Taxus chinensis]
CREGPCYSSPSTAGVASIVTPDVFNSMVGGADSGVCRERGFIIIMLSLMLLRPSKDLVHLALLMLIREKWLPSLLTLPMRQE